MWQHSASVFRSTERAIAAAALGAVLALACLPCESEARSISGIARVNDAGEIVVAGTRVALAGIEVPTFGRVCRRTVSPVRCGPPAVLILDDLVRGFVHCDVTGERAPGRREGRCTVAGRRLLEERIDLATELLREGWAFALDDAPSFYRALERMARSRGIGIWGDQAFDLR